MSVLLVSFRFVVPPFNSPTHPSLPPTAAEAEVCVAFSSRACPRRALCYRPLLRNRQSVVPLFVASLVPGLPAAAAAVDESEACGTFVTGKAPRCSHNKFL
ncbi:hypothetical protein EVAR_19319_1 [Eumeta japonica]|uniref:Uncharacterized protein n=1 Tax=Eumeta variegata TaxID=151549 RepID=A0A4C1UD86_EUMVA|nr:hypothetical protein EVAR_19319_1 [Eumeta japonica]